MVFSASVIKSSELLSWLILTRAGIFSMLFKVFNTVPCFQSKTFIHKFHQSFYFLTPLNQFFSFLEFLKIVNVEFYEMNGRFSSFILIISQRSPYMVIEISRYVWAVDHSLYPALSLLHVFLHFLHYYGIHIFF